MSSRRIASVLLMVLLVALPAGCRRGTSQGSPRISPYQPLQRYTLEGPITPIGLPRAGEQIRIELVLRDASDASGTLHLFRDDVWVLFGPVVGGWDGSIMSLHSEDGRGDAMRFELAFRRSSVRGTALVFWRARGEPIRYGVELAYR